MLKEREAGKKEREAKVRELGCVIMCPPNMLV